MVVASLFVERQKLNPPRPVTASESLMGEPSTIPEAGHENPGSGPQREHFDRSRSDQTKDDQRLMSLGMALARALQQLPDKSGNQEP